MDAPTQIHPEIYLAKNFLSSQEMAAIKEYSDSLSRADWELKGDDAPSLSTIALSSTVLGKLQEVFSTEEYVVRNFNKIQRRRVREENHGITHYARKLEGIRCVVSSLIVVNDDYEGGELVFVNQNNFTVKPEAGSIIYFPPTEEFAYLVNKITSGSSRYVIPEDIYIVEPDFPELTPLSL